MKKRLVLLLAVMLVLTGCGNAEVPEESGEISSVAGEVEEVTSEQPEASEEKTESEEEEESESSEESSEEIDASETEEESGEASEEAEAPEESAAFRSGDADTATASSEETAAPTPTPTPTPTPVETAEATPTPEAAQTNTPIATQTQAPAATPTPQPVHTHSWDSGTVTQAATCTAEGVKTYTCTSCGSTKTESIAKTDHNYAWLWNLDEDLGNCTRRNRLVDICADCGYILNTYSDTTYQEHEWGDVVWGEGSTCTSSVTYTYTCLKCGTKFSDTAGPNGHRLDSLGNCKDCGEHVEHQWLWDEVDGKYYCYCGAEKE